MPVVFDSQFYVQGSCMWEDLAGLGGCMAGLDVTIRQLLLESAFLGYIARTIRILHAETRSAVTYMIH